MLALHGFDAYGLDVSATGVGIARGYAETEFPNPQEYNFGSMSEVERPDNTRGEVTFIEGDFFQTDWETGIRFDVIYDYTVGLTFASIKFNLACELTICSFCVPCTLPCAPNGQLEWRTFFPQRGC